MFACTARAIDRWVSSRVPLYAFEFADATAPSYLAPTTFPIAAGHTLELPYLFPGFHGGEGLPVALNAMQASLSNDMVTYWSNVSAASNREEEWARYDRSRENVLSLALPAPHMTEKSFSIFHKCAFWDGTGMY